MLQEMHKLHVKGNPGTLNLLLKGFILLKKESVARRLYQTMKRRKVEVWEGIQKALPAGWDQEAREKVEVSEQRIQDQAERKQKAQADMEALMQYKAEKLASRRSASGSEADGKPASSDSAISVKDPSTPRVVRPPRSGKLIPMDRDHLEMFARHRRLSWVSIRYLEKFVRDREKEKQREDLKTVGSDRRPPRRMSARQIKASVYRFFGVRPVERDEEGTEDANTHDKSLKRNNEEKTPFYGTRGGSRPRRLSRTKVSRR